MAGVGGEGRVAVVTGASSGIGRVTALRLAAQGYTVVGVARRAPQLEVLVDLLRADAPASSHLVGDLSERGFAQDVIARTRARHGRIDVLVNNAGVPLHKDLYRISVDEAERVFRINFFSCLWLTFAAIPPMLEQGSGCIVNVSSIAAEVVPTHETVYAASKAAMNGFTQGLFNDLEGSGIHAALVHPGPIDTEIWNKLDEPGAYSGRRYPAESVADAILECIETGRREVTVPRRNPALMAARALRVIAPALLRKGVARNDPLAPAALERARMRAARGLPLGDEKSDEESDEAGEARGTGGPVDREVT